MCGTRNSNRPLFYKKISLFFRKLYSRTSLMWTPDSRTKSIHNSGVSTVVKQLVSTPAKLDCIRKTERALGKVFIMVGCSHRWGVHKVGFYCTGKHIHKGSLKCACFPKVNFPRWTCCPFYLGSNLSARKQLVSPSKTRLDKVSPKMSFQC